MTIYSKHIEKPIRTFGVRVLHRACFNVFYRPERWETWRVLAQTPEGALRIARYHFYGARQICLFEAAADVSASTLPPASTDPNATA